MPLFWFDNTSGYLSWNRAPEQLNDQIALYLVSTDSIGRDLVFNAISGLPWFQEVQNVYALDDAEERRKLLVSTRQMIIESLGEMKRTMITSQLELTRLTDRKEAEEKSLPVNGFFSHQPQDAVVMTVAASTYKSILRLKVDMMMGHYAHIRKLRDNIQKRIATCSVIVHYIKESFIAMNDEDKKKERALRLRAAGEPYKSTAKGTGSDQCLMDRSARAISRLQGVIGFSITRGGLTLRRSLLTQCNVVDPPLVNSLHPPPPPAFSVASLYN
jgi:hypothetical protein